ncbi:cell wall-binding repeat-containing protein [Clostridium tyrobutyricum]|uniref:cell wall-binding repeat-containing protein n=1 Tax=Clostridium tyrobutyricum TaxID=1519 RepID=UPI001C387D06|nr:cell wall-binding repeat-containing protein [Clostridium tyrobutyricum]MBV4446876.1 cell wall-binding repeat-containing protein [Clostridium tyrobutyricum]
MNKKGTKALASATLMSLVLTTALATGNVKAAANGQATRVGGTDRYETAAKVATTNFTTSDNVVLVSGEGYADSVSASVLAKKLNAPIVLTGSQTLDANAKSAIETLKAKNVYIIGGTGSISASIESGLKSNYTVTRLGGKDRYATNLAIANKLVDLGVSKDNIIAVAGTGFADALSVAPVAAADNEILLLTKNDTDAMKATADFAKDSNVTVVGTTNVVNGDIYNQLKADKRIDGGADRFATNINVLNAFDSDLKADKLYVANATQANPDNLYADALVASAIAGKYSAPLVLTSTEGSTATNNAVSYIGTKATKATDLQVVGGTGVISDATVSAIEDAVPKEPVFDGTVTSVETVKDQYVNSKANDETLEFTVNGGEEASVSDLVSAGYNVKFTATADVFDNSDATTSKDGSLSKDNLKTFLGSDNDKTFKYQVQITKDDQIIATSGYETVTVINGDQTANSLSDITIKKGTTADDATSKITSGKFVKGDHAVVTKVKGNIDGASDVTVTNTKFYSSNPFVASVDETTGEIIANNAGTFTLTVKSGSTSKDYSYTVTNDTSRTLTTVSADKSSVKIGKSATTSFYLTAKDQLGDPIVAEPTSTGTSTSDDNGIQVNNVKDGDDTIANVTATLPSSTDDQNDGKVLLTITGNSIAGNGNLKIYNKNGLISTISVTTTGDTSTNNIKIEAATNDDKSKNLTLDLDPKAADNNDDAYVKLNVNKYSSNGTYVGKYTSGDLGNLVVTVTDNSNKQILGGSSPATVVPDSNGDILIKLPSSDETTSGTDLTLPVNTNNGSVHTGTLTVTATDGDNAATTTLTVKDSTPSISSASLTSGVEIDSGSALSIKDVLKASNISASVSEGDGKVRIAQDGTIFVKSDANKNNDSSIKDINDSTIGYDAKYDITLGRIVVTNKNGTSGDYAINNGSTGTITANTSTSGDKYITVGVQRVHDDTPFTTTNVKVN